MGQIFRCQNQNCKKKIDVKTDLNKPRKIKCKCGYENTIQKEKNGKLKIS